VLAVQSVCLAEATSLPCPESYVPTPRRRRLRARRRRKGGQRNRCGERHMDNRPNSCGKPSDFACTAIQLLTRSGANQFVNGWLTIAAAFPR